MRPPLTIREFLEEEHDSLKMELLAGEAGLDRTLAIPDVNRPGLALAGYLHYFAFDRAQVMGLTEINYLRELDPASLQERLESLFQFDIPCFIFTRSLMPMPLFLEMADRAGVPVMRSLLTTTSTVSKITVFLDEKFSPETTVHGTLVDVHGVGALIIGRPGVGKSEAALELVERGHRLVADDAVSIKRRADRYLYGEASAVVKHHMEIRGVGIIDVRAIFGVGAVRKTKRIKMAIELEDWDADKQYDRLGIAEDTFTILELRVPKVRIPVRPGRNMAVIIEVAALNQALRDMGVNTAQALEQRLLNALRGPEAE